MAKLLLMVMATVAACTPGPVSPASPAERCDSRVDDRQRWFSARDDKYNDRSPSDIFRVLGDCSDQIIDNRFSCDKADVRRVIGDSPYLHDAQALGFKTYVCELASDQHNRIPYPLADVLTKRASHARPVARATRADVDDHQIVMEVMAKLEGFKDDMCQCQAGDKACAEQVSQDMKVYMDSFKGKEPDPKLVTEADQTRMMKMMTEMAKCQMAATGP